MRRTELVLIALFLKTSNFYLPAYLYIYILSLAVTDLSQILIGELGRTLGIFLAGVKGSKFSGLN